jgi:uncharacterized protein YybS (DUF2232 family)
MPPAPRLALAVAVTSAAYVAALLWPALAVPLLLFAPLPALVLAVAAPGGYAGAWLAITATLTGAVLGVEAALGFVLPIGIPAIVLAVGIRRFWSFDRTVLAGVLSWCLGVGLLLFFAYGDAPAALAGARAQLAGSFDLAVATSRSMGAPEATIAAMEADRDVVIATFLDLLPAFMVLAGGLLVIANVLMVRAWTGVYREVNLRLWQAPDILIWALIAAGFGMFVPGAAVAARNVFIVLLGCYFCQGLAIVSYYLVRFRLPRTVRIASYALIAMHQVLTATVLALGVFDFWANFRRRSAADLQFRE